MMLSNGVPIQGSSGTAFEALRRRIKEHIGRPLGSGRGKAFGQFAQRRGRANVMDADGLKAELPKPSKPSPTLSIDLKPAYTGVAQICQALHRRRIGLEPKQRDGARRIVQRAQNT